MLAFRPMPFTDDAVAVLTETQERLRELLAAALQAHAYQEVASIAGYAEQVSKLLNGSGTPNRRISLHSQPVPAADAPTGKSRSRKTLPRFERDGDRLVKVAWSKKERAEYEHRAPRHIV